MLLCLVASFLLVACRATPSTPPPTQTPTAAPPTDPAAQRQAVERLLGALTAAIEAKDSAAYAALISSRDATFPHRSQIIFANLTSLPITDLEFNADATTGKLSSDRQAQLGASAWVQKAVVRWRIPGDSEPAENTLWLTVLPGGPATVQLAGLTDGSTTHPDAVPLWMLERVEAEQAGHGTSLVASDLEAGDQWAKAADEASAKIASRVKSIAPHWSGDVTVELPSLVTNFEQTAGVVRGTYGGIAAVTIALGSGKSSPLHIVLNPKLIKQLTGDGVGILLTHESTHVATRSVDSPARLWVTEGFADYVAYAAYPSGRGPAEEPLITSVRKFGVPPTLPTDASFDPSSRSLGATYAQAYLAWRYADRAYGASTVPALYVQRDTGRSLDAASQQVLHISSTAFIAGWRNYVAGIAR